MVVIYSSLSRRRIETELDPITPPEIFRDLIKTTKSTRHNMGYCPGEPIKIRSLDLKLVSAMLPTVRRSSLPLRLVSEDEMERVVGQGNLREV